MMLEQYLDSLEGCFDAHVGLQGTMWHGPGYHTRIPEGAHVHPTRENLQYAVLLLRSTRPDDAARAIGIIEKVLHLQDVDPTSKTYGIWPWLYEEPLEQMAPPDWNWADFCGASLAVILHENGGRLPDRVAVDVRTALDHAAASIFRRNVGFGYTNIAIMGACVTAATGEILGEKRWLEYGRSRLYRFVEYTDWHGGLNEYNSPPYTLVALHECERILQIVSDPGIRRAAEILREKIWGFMAERFHPATGQLAGPHSRAYSDLLSPETAGYIADMTGVSVVGAADQLGDEAISVVHHLPCPDRFKSRFAELPDSECELRSRFIRRNPDEASTYGHTWLCSDACLGTVNYDSLWIQRRTILAYFATEGKPAVLKVSFLRNGAPCASAVVRTVQEGRSALSVFQLATDLGDHHINLDRPEDGVFHAHDLRIRYELTGVGVTAEQLNAGLFVMNVARWRIVLRTASPIFDGKLGFWNLQSEVDRIYVDAVLWQGKERDFQFSEIGTTFVVVAMELLRPDEPLDSELPAIEEHNEKSTVRWRGFTVTMPRCPYPFLK